LSIIIKHFHEDNADFALLSSLLDAEADTILDPNLRKLYHIDNHRDVIEDVFIAYDGKEPVACASFKRKGEDTAEVKRVYTKPAYRGKGLSRKIMQMVETEAAKQGYKRMVLETSVELESAVRMYEGLGYRPIPNFPPYENSVISICKEKKLHYVKTQE